MGRETDIVNVAELLDVLGGCKGFVDVDVHLGLELLWLLPLGLGVVVHVDVILS